MTLLTLSALAGSRTFSSLRRHRNYRLFFLGQVISVSGTWMQNIALYWLVLSLTHSPLAIGVLSIARFSPFTFFSLPAGTIVDRFDQRKLCILTQTIQLILSAALATLAMTGAITVWQVDLIAFLGGSVLVLDAPSRQGLTYQMVGRGELPNAVALNTTLFNIGRIVGPSVAGLIIGVSGVGWCFALNAASFLAVLASLMLMRVAELFPLDRPDRPTVLSGAGEGLAFVRSTPQIIAVLTTSVIFASFLFNVNLLLPVLTKNTLHSGAQVFGLLTAAYGGGALVGALSSATVARPTWRGASSSATAYAVLALIVAPLHSVYLIALCFFLSGMCFTIYNTTVQALVQLAAPDRLRGRAISIYFYSSNGFIPVGSLLIAWLCTVGGTELAFFVLGFAGLGAIAFASWRLKRSESVEVVTPVTEAAAG